jgi:hypothetical protein
MGQHLLVVYTNAVEGQEDRYNKWYDETHVPDCVAIPGVVSARRLELSPVGMPGAPTPAHKYLALYEIDGDPAAVMEALRAGVVSGDIEMSDALDSSATSVSVYSYRDQKDG